MTDRQRLVSALLDAGFLRSEVFDDDPEQQVLVSAPGLWVTVAGVKRLMDLAPDCGAFDARDLLRRMCATPEPRI